MSYDPKNSQVTDDALADFVASDVESDLKTVPGIGPKAEDKLKTIGIKSTGQLIGKFFLLCDPETTTQEHCNAMWTFLNDAGVNSHRAGIVKAIAEKANTLISGTYDEAALDSTTKK